MPRHARPRPTRRIVTGAPVASKAGDRLTCVLLAPAPDWAVLELSTGAILRGALEGAETSELLAADPLTAVSIRLAEADGPEDPSRPEAISVASIEDSPAPRRRALRALLDQVVVSPGERPLLGSVGPSVAYGDLDGSRPSLSLLAPEAGRVVFAGGEGLTAHFRLGSAAFALPVASGLAGWLVGGQLPTSHGTARKRTGGRRRAGKVGPLGPATEPSVPVRALVGFDRPQRGQVRKVLLGLVPVL